MTTPHDFSTISPSAKSLLLVKAQTTLPFARAAAELLWGTAAVQAAERRAAGTVGSDVRRTHFELRARSLDDALESLGLTSVLEIAAGLSLRGLAMAAHAGVFYVDTDLPELAAIKSDLVAKLHPGPLAGQLRIQPLDALDRVAFRAAADAIPAGPLAIVHEGLLMYLDDAEKATLAANIRGVLLEHGGAWVTADVYVRSEAHLVREERAQRFLDAHRVEEKMFADWRAAEAFFVAQGFTIAKRLRASSNPWRVRETWILSPRA